MRFLKDSKAIMHIALPMLSSRLLNIITFFSGFIMIARLGTQELAASSLANSLFITILLVGVGILYATGIKISHAFGAGSIPKIREYFYSSIVLALIISIVSIFILILVSFSLSHLGQDPKLIPEAKKFLHALCLPLIPAMLSVVSNQLVTALLKPRIIFVASVVTVPITIGLLYLFIFGGLGIPPLGVWGFGIAFLISDIFTVAIPAIYIFTNPYFDQFQLKSLKNISENLLKRLFEIVKLGLPMGIQFGLEIACFSVITFFIGRFGIPALNALQISSQLVVIGFMIPMTITEAAAILVGNALGRKNPNDIRSYGYSSVKLSLLFVAVAVTLFFSVPKLFIHIYINVNNPLLHKTVHLSILFLYVSAIILPIDGVRNVFAGALRGLHDSKYPMYICALVLWLIGLPIGATLAFTTSIGPIGFLYGDGFALIICLVTLMIRFNKKSKPENINYTAHDH